jgi:hypothetical protein
MALVYHIESLEISSTFLVISSNNTIIYSGYEQDIKGTKSADK